MIRLSIDLNKINKARAKAHQNGALYYDIVLMERDDRFGNNFMVTESVSKEERLAGVKGNILGNGKIFGSGAPSQGGQAQTRHTPPPVQTNGGAADTSDVPFMRMDGPCV